MKHQKRILLVVTVLMVLFIVVFKATNETIIDQDTLEHLTLEKSKSGDESQKRQYISHLLFQQAGIITALLLLPLGFVFLKNRSVSRHLSGKLSKWSQTRITTTQGFVEKLMSSYPDLTAYDLSLCEMLIDKLSSKEIAMRLNISPASVNTARYRLRKKLRVPQQVELFTFLYQFRS